MLQFAHMTTTNMWHWELAQLHHKMHPRLSQQCSTVFQNTSWSIINVCFVEILMCVAQLLIIETVGIFYPIIGDQLGVASSAHHSCLSPKSKQRRSRDALVPDVQCGFFPPFISHHQSKHTAVNQSTHIRPQSRLTSLVCLFAAAPGVCVRLLCCQRHHWGGGQLWVTLHAHTHMHAILDLKWSGPASPPPPYFPTTLQNFQNNHVLCLLISFSSLTTSTLCLFPLFFISLCGPHFQAAKVPLPHSPYLLSFHLQALQFVSMSTDPLIFSPCLMLLNVKPLAANPLIIIHRTELHGVLRNTRERNQRPPPGGTSGDWSEAMMEDSQSKCLAGGCEKRGQQPS